MRIVGPHFSLSVSSQADFRRVVHVRHRVGGPRTRWKVITVTLRTTSIWLPCSGGALVAFRGEPAGQSNRAPRRLPARDRHGEDTDDRHRVRAPRHGTWNHAKEFRAAIAATHRKRATPLVELGEVAAFVACDRAAAMTGTVANLTGGEIVD